MRRRLVVTLVLIGTASATSACANGSVGPGNASATSDRFGPNAALPGVVPDCSAARPQYVQIKPSAVILSCPRYSNRGIAGITDVTWRSWGESKAEGRGYVWSSAGGNSCPPGGGTPPTCGATAKYYPAGFTLLKPRESADGPAFSTLAVTYRKAGPPNGKRGTEFEVPQPLK
jgi:hypothetical protein